MLGKILGRHSKVHAFPELQVFERHIDESDLSRAPIGRQALITVGAKIATDIEHGVFSKNAASYPEEKIADLIDRYKITDPVTLYQALLHEHTAAAGKSVSCEQTPRYLFLLEKLLECYPNARAVHIYRDPRAVMLSQKNRWRRAGLSTGPKRSVLWTLTSWSNYHPIVTSSLWRASMNKAKVLNTHPRLTQIKFEDLLLDSENILLDLCAFMDLPFEPAMLDVPVEGSSTREDIQLQRGIDRSRVDTWRQGGLKPSELEICEKIAGQEMKDLGYELSGTQASWPQRIISYVSLFPKAVIAITLNFRRFKNIFAFLKRRFA